MAHDVVIKNGTVIDGTGSPALALMSRSTAIKLPRSAKT